MKTMNFIGIRGRSNAIRCISSTTCAPASRLTLDWQLGGRSLVSSETHANTPRSHAESKCWYFHGWLRSAPQSREAVIQHDHLPTYLKVKLKSLGIIATSNTIEGAEESCLKAMISYHLGMPSEHRRRSCERFSWNRGVVRPFDWQWACSCCQGAARPPRGTQRNERLMPNRSARSLMAPAPAIRRDSSSGGIGQETSTGDCFYGWTVWEHAWGRHHLLPMG